MTAARRLAAILGADRAGYEAGMARAVHERLGAARPITFNANDCFPTATSVDAIRNDRFTSICDVQSVTTNVHVGSIPAIRPQTNE